MVWCFCFELSQACHLDFRLPVDSGLLQVSWTICAPDWDRLIEGALKGFVELTWTPESS